MFGRVYHSEGPDNDDHPVPHLLPAALACVPTGTDQNDLAEVGQQVEGVGEDDGVGGGANIHTLPRAPLDDVGESLWKKLSQGGVVSALGDFYPKDFSCASSLVVNPSINGGVYQGEDASDVSHPFLVLSDRLLVELNKVLDSLDVNLLNDIDLSMKHRGAREGDLEELNLHCKALREFKKMLVRTSDIGLLNPMLGIEDDMGNESDMIDLQFKTYSTRLIPLPKATVSILQQGGEVAVAVNEKEAMAAQFVLKGFEIVSRPVSEVLDLTHADDAPLHRYLRERFVDGMPIIYGVGEFVGDETTTSMAIPLSVICSPDSLTFDNPEMDTKMLGEQGDALLSNHKKENKERVALMHCIVSEIPKYIERFFARKLRPSPTQEGDVGFSAARSSVEPPMEDTQVTVPLLAFHASHEPHYLGIKMALKEYLEYQHESEHPTGLTNYILNPDNGILEMFQRFLFPENEESVELSQSCDLRNYIKDVIAKERLADPGLGSLEPCPDKEISSSATLMIKNETSNALPVGLEDLELTVLVLKAYCQHLPPGISYQSVSSSLIQLAKEGRLQINGFHFGWDPAATTTAASVTSFLSHSVIADYDDGAYQGATHSLQELLPLIQLVCRAKALLLDPNMTTDIPVYKQSFGVIINKRHHRTECLGRLILWAMFHNSSVTESPVGTMMERLEFFIANWHSSKLIDGPCRYLGRPYAVAFGEGNVTIKVALNAENKLTNCSLSANTDCRSNVILAVATDRKLEVKGMPSVLECLNLNHQAKAVCLQGQVPFVIPCLRGTENVNRGDILRKAVAEIVDVWQPPNDKRVLDYPELIQFLLYHIGICFKLASSSSIIDSKEWMKQYANLGLSYLSSTKANWLMLILHIHYCTQYLDLLVMDMRQSDESKRMLERLDLTAMHSFLYSPTQHQPEFIMEWNRDSANSSKGQLIEHLIQSEPNLSDHYLQECLAEGTTGTTSVDKLSPILARITRKMALVSGTDLWENREFCILDPSNVVVDRLATALM